MVTTIIAIVRGKNVLFIEGSIANRIVWKTPIKVIIYVTNRTKTLISYNHDILAP